MNKPILTEEQVIVMEKFFKGELNHYSASPQEDEIVDQLVNIAQDWMHEDWDKNSLYLFNDPENPKNDIFVMLHKLHFDIPFEIIEDEDELEKRQLETIDKME